MFSRLMDRGVWYTLATGFKLQLYLNIATPNYISAVFFQPAVMAILTGLIFTVSGKTEHLDYAVVGASMFGVWNSNLYASAGIIQGERRFGTLEFLATTRSPLFLVILGKTMGAAVFSLFSLVVSMAVMAVAFQYRLHVANGWVFLLSIVVSMITVTVVGLLLSSLSVVTRYYYRIFDFFYLVFILSGLVFPIDLLPRCIQPLCYLLPTTWSILLYRAGLGTVDGDRWMFYTAGSIAITAVYLIVAFFVYRTVIHKARVEARLGRY